jgi:hypothetical protein
MTTPQFVELAIHGAASPELIPVSDIKRVVRTAARNWVEMELLSADGERLRVMVAGSFKDWAERLAARRSAEVDGQQLAEAVSRYAEQGERR